MSTDSVHATGLEAFSNLQQELDRCMKCGFCMSVCPVYNAEKNEGGVARGKITIAEAVIAGQLELEDQEVIGHAVRLPGLQIVHDGLPVGCAVRSHHA
ncbi:MAG: 4Fe-4S dicluster domain-containing protein [Ignavibacteriota bacterium]